MGKERATRAQRTRSPARFIEIASGVPGCEPNHSAEFISAVRSPCASESAMVELPFPTIQFLPERHFIRIEQLLAIGGAIVDALPLTFLVVRGKEVEDHAFPELRLELGLSDASVQ